MLSRAASDRTQELSHRKRLVPAPRAVEVPEGSGPAERKDIDGERVGQLYNPVRWETGTSTRLHQLPSYRQHRYTYHVSDRVSTTLYPGESAEPSAAADEIKSGWKSTRRLP